MPIDLQHPPVKRDSILEKAKALINKAEEDKSLQYSDQALRNRIRILAPLAIKRLAKLMNSTDEKIAVQASKILLGKVIPDLKSLAVTESKQIQGLVIVRHQDQQTTIDISDSPITIDGETE